MIMAAEGPLTGLDLFEYLAPYRVLACRLCATGVVPAYLVSHIRTHHREHSGHFKTPRSAARWVQERLLPSLLGDLLDPVSETISYPLLDSDAILVLTVHTGYGCIHCEYVAKTRALVS